MTDEQRQQINYAKNELRNYMYLLNVVHGFEGKILEIETELEGVRSPSAPKTPGKSFISPEERKQDLLTKLQRHQYSLAMYKHRTDHIAQFLDGLSYEERKIVTEVYVNNVNIEKVATLALCSVSKLKRDLDKMLENF
ncbi:hypothetical protein AOC36_09600 [Erysipelothrix larvae]|uniref:Uncharacterized protein n=1 Tax=Erysipelothrix larvae TaxID=1514105 RepID=A0A0X8H176_9FIRM|nr:hypothetical protein [Erysipelothrix larvae]AMC94227.1 hypothetical protein AOC36_09600 [Erysipelothrix larvae]